MIEDAVVDMTYEAVKQADVRKRIAKTLAGYEAERATEEKPESYFIKKEIRRIDTAFERIWQAIEDGIAPPGGRERTTELKRQRAELEARLRVAEQSEALEPSVDDVLLWLDDLANDTTPLEILNEFVRFVEIDGKDVTVYFMFDELPDDFTPKQKKGRTPLLPKVFDQFSYGGGAENRTPVHESPLIGISKLSRWFCLGRFARSDTLAASQPVRS